MVQPFVLSEAAFNALTDIIFKTLDYDRGRGGHTIETLLAVFHRMGMLAGDPEVLENSVRLRIAQLISDGALDMRPDGQLILPAETPDQEVVKFAKDWYSVITGRHIGGPFKTEGEAQKDVSAFISYKR